MKKPQHRSILFAVTLALLATTACPSPPSPDGGVDAGAIDAGAIDDVDAGDVDGGMSHDDLCAEQPDEDNPTRFYERNLLRFAAPDDAGVDVEVTLTRLPVDWVGESSVYALQRLSVATSEGTVCITDPDDLDYVNSHHNFEDDAVAVIDGDTHLLQMRITWDNVTGEREWIDTYSVTDADGDVVVGPVRLFENSGAELR